MTNRKKSRNERSARRGGNTAPVRRPSNRGGVRKNIGKTPSLKAKRNVWWESLLERDYILLLEIDPDVVTYREQPFRLRYTIDGRVRHYTPDFLVERKNKRQIVEVKPKVKSSTEAFRLFYLTVEPLIRKLGYEFIVADDEMIRVKPLLENVKILKAYARTPFLPGHALLCQKFLRENGSACIADLARAFSGKGLTLPIIYSLIYRSVLVVDLNLPLDPSSIVRPTTLGSTLTGTAGEGGRA
jgi:hypothetical protein